MNGQRPNGQRRPVNRPQNAGPNGQRRQDINDALNERYEEMVAPGRRADDINRGKYADLSTFESRGHRKIDPAVMRARKRKELIRKCIPIAAAALIALVALWVYLGVMRPASQYKEAIALFEKEDYSSAEKLFDKLEDYKDTRDYVAYIDARNAYKNGDYSGAKLIYESLGDFYDSAEKALDAAEKADPDKQKENDYNKALGLLESGDYTAAAEAFTKLGSYRDSAEKAVLAKNELDYAEAVRLLDAGELHEAKEIFLSLGSFRDSAEKAENIADDIQADERADTYARALEALDEGRLSAANLLFNELGGYLDSKRYADYTYAVMCYNGGDYGTAMVCFEACGDLLDAAERTYDAKYLYALSLYQSADGSRLPEVIGLFDELGDYSDSADMLYSAREQYKSAAVFAYYDGDLEGALAIFESLGEHPGCAEWAQQIKDELA